MKTTIDPNKAYTGNPDHLLLEACGFIPFWVREWSDMPTTQTLKDYLIARYGFGFHKMGGTVTETGVYQYPEDPDLDPLIAMDTDEGTLYMYEYAIVAIPTVNGYEVARMD